MRPRADQCARLRERRDQSMARHLPRPRIAAGRRSCRRCCSSPAARARPSPTATASRRASAAASGSAAATPSESQAAPSFTPGTAAAPAHRGAHRRRLPELHAGPRAGRGRRDGHVPHPQHRYRGPRVHDRTAGATPSPTRKARRRSPTSVPDQTGDITFTFDGTGPFAFACHAPGHFEHGMAGYVQLVGPGRADRRHEGQPAGRVAEHGRLPQVHARQHRRRPG